MSKTSSKSKQMTFLDMPAPISLRELEAGNMHSSLQGGLVTEKSGQEAAHANHFPLLGKDWAAMTLAIYGQSGLDSSKSANLQLLLESKLLQRMAGIGSPEYELIWRHWVMKLGPQICALRALAPPILGNACGGWPTPNCVEIDELPEDIIARQKRNIALQKETGQRKFIPGLTLGSAVHLVTGWGTPTARDHKDGSCNLSNVPVNSLLGRQALQSVVQTEKQGALNPDHSRWLMGYPTGWANCAPTETPSYLKLRRNL